MRKRLLTLFSLTLSLLLVSEFQADMASASLKASVATGGSTTISSANWAAVATTTPLTPGTSAYVNSGVTSAGGGGNNGTYFSIVNTGTVDLLNVSLSLTTTTTKSNSYDIFIHGCSATWNESTGACTSGTISLLYSLSVPTSGTLAQKSSAGDAAIPLSIGASKRLRIQYSGGGSPTITATINMLITKNNMRAANNNNF